MAPYNDPEMIWMIIWRFLFSSVNMGKESFVQASEI